MLELQKDYNRGEEDYSLPHNQVEIWCGHVMVQVTDDATRILWDLYLVGTSPAVLCIKCM